MHPTRRLVTSAARCCLLGLLLPSLLLSGAERERSTADRGWSDPIEVRQGTKPVVSYRAGVWQGWLVVEADHQKGWHTYAMDNQRRADERLEGKPSLGIEAATELRLLSGLKRTETWRQSRPADYSKPELRWYTWGFDGRVYFACRVERKAEAKVELGIKGQACNDKSCRMIDIKLAIPPRASNHREEPPIDVKRLVEVVAR